MLEYKNTILKPINPKLKTSITPISNTSYHPKDNNNYINTHCNTTYNTNHTNTYTYNNHNNTSATSSMHSSINKNNNNSNANKYKTKQNKSSKIQNNVMIKPSGNYQRYFDYKFQTQQEIEKEEQCRRFQNHVNWQKKNNSFSSSGTEYIVVEKCKRNRKKLEFYNCDSLAIRPSGNMMANLNKKQSINSHNNVQKYTDNQQSQQQTIKQNNITLYNKIRTGLTSQPQIIRQYPQIPSQTQKQTQTTSKSLLTHNLRPSSLKKQKCKIFDQKYTKNKSKFYQSLPMALLPYTSQDCRYQDKNNNNVQDQCHIIFQTDQITQCCL